MNVLKKFLLNWIDKKEKKSEVIYSEAKTIYQGLVEDVSLLSEEEKEKAQKEMIEARNHLTNLEAAISEQKEKIRQVRNLLSKI